MLRELEEAADRLSYIVSTDYEETMLQLQNAWKGEAAERFLQKADRLGEMMQEAYGCAEDAAQTYRAAERAKTKKRQQAIEGEYREHKTGE